MNEHDFQVERKKIQDATIHRTDRDALGLREGELASAIVCLRRIATFENRWGPGDEALIARAWLSAYEILYPEAYEGSA